MIIMGCLLRCVTDADDLHVSCVAEVDAGLIGAFIWSILKRDDVLAGFELLIAEISDVLLGFLGSNRSFAEVLALKENFLFWALSKSSHEITHFSAQWLQADDNRV